MLALHSLAGSFASPLLTPDPYCTPAAWARLKVAEQVERIHAGGDGDGDEGKLLIPASYTPGVTLIAKKGSDAARKLAEAAGRGP